LVKRFLRISEYYKMNKERKKEMDKELSKLAAEIEAEAIQMRLDYETNPSNMDSGSVIEVHQDSDLLASEEFDLHDVAYEIKRKKRGEK